MPLFNTSMGGPTPKTLVTPDGTTDSIAIEKVDGKTVKPSSTLGNATADKVLQGYTFTSDGGFDIAGTSTASKTIDDSILKSENISSLLEKSKENIQKINSINYEEYFRINKSVPANSNLTTVLDVSGSGKLHMILASGTTNWTTIKDQYVKVTFDNSYIMYVGMLSNYDSSSYKDYSSKGFFFVLRYFMGYQSRYSSYNNLLFHCFGIEDSVVYTRYNSTWKWPGNFERFFMNPQFPCEANSVDNLFPFVASHEPLKFDSSLKIECLSGANSASVEVIYSVDS